MFYVKKINKDPLLSIKEENQQEKYWTTKERTVQNPVPNMSGRAPGSCGSSQYIEDIFIEKELPDSFVQKIFEVVKNNPKTCLYVHDGPFGFYPIFGLIEHTSPLLAGYNGEKKNEYVMKFKQSNFCKKDYKEFIKILYSKENKLKHNSFSLSPISNLSHYEY